MAGGGSPRRGANARLCLWCLAERPGAAFAQRLRGHLLATGLTRAALARRAGLEWQTVDLAERGRPPWGTVELLTGALGVGAEVLLPP